MRNTDIDKSPYFADYDPAKRFYQILFKAGTTVQSRELCEIQDILMNQIEAIGTNLFKNGSVVVPGHFNVTSDLKSLAFLVGDSGIKTTLFNASNVYVRGITSSVVAKIVKLVDVDSTNTSMYAFCDITKSGSDGVTSDFTSNEVLQFFTVDDSDVETEITRTICTGIGLGTYASVTEGIYFIRGMMVRCETQEIILSRTDKVTSSVGFIIAEEIITSDNDDTLLSNALGFPNYKAPGADRLRLTITLDTRTVGTDDPNFLELARINVGEIEMLLASVEYNELAKVLAQRTYEESGNYSVGDTQVEIREHLNDGTNDGVYLSTYGGDATKLVSVIEPNVHYVLGYRVENTTPQLVSIDKARDTAILNNSVTPIIYGAYLEVNAAHGTPIINYNIQYTIRNASDVQIGTFRVVSAKKTSGGIIQLIVRKVSFTGANTWTNASKVRATNGTDSFYATVVTKGLVSSGMPSLIFNLPKTGVKSLESSGLTDTTYSVARDFAISLNASGVGSITAPSGSIFTSQFDTFFLSSATDIEVEISGVDYTLGGSPVGSTITVDAGIDYANESVRLLSSVQKLTSSPRSKRKTTAVETITTNGTDLSYALSNSDVILLNSVTRGTDDVTSQFSIDGGQKDDSYEKGTLKANIEQTTGDIVVSYDYFVHGSGDYFCVDSYSGIDFEDIPTYTDTAGNVYDLADCIDFRKTAQSSGQYVVSDSAAQYSSLTSDLEFYLGKYVSLYVNSDGDYDIVEGISSETPAIPDVPASSMRLANILLEPYTLNTDDVSISYINNRRYTMRDIGKLEQRIENLEYYTSLSQLETSANNIQVIDAITGNDRFKNGIFADPFIDFRLFNAEDEGSFASIDSENGGLKPQVDSLGVTMEYVSGGANKDGMLSASIAFATTFDRQPYATMSINVNPYAVYSWAGFVSLSPAKDFWVDTVYTAPKIVNQTINYRGAAVAGVQWGAWNGSSRKVTTTTFTEWSSTSTTDNIVSTQVIPYMRSITIQFKATGLRPATRVYPWFYNKNVSAYCAPNGGSKGQALISDINGNLVGYFYVPNSNVERFATGATSFVLCDNSSTPTDQYNRTTYAEASFSSGGTLITHTKTTTQTRYLGVSTRTTYEYRRVDPIAQTFTVEQKGGLFLQAVDVYFKHKAKSIPITLEIRECSNGLPTDDVVTRATLNPSSVVVSDSGTASTRFSFEPLAYLNEGGEYAIVLLANTQEYEAYLCELGGRVINSSQTIASQPHTGVFLASSNGSTWTPHQTRDLKFQLIRSTFNTASETITLRGGITAQGRNLASNPLKSTSGSSLVQIDMNFHGSNPGDFITLEGVIGGNGIDSTALNKALQVVSVQGFTKVTVETGVTATATGQFGGTECFATGRNLINNVYINVDKTVYEKTSAKFEISYRLAASRVMSGWLEVTPGETVFVPEEGSYASQDDLLVRITVGATATVSPMIDTQGFTVMLNAMRVDTSEDLMDAVSFDIYLDNPSTSSIIYISHLIPTTGSLELAVKYLRDTESDWTVIAPTTPVSVGGTVYTENKFSTGDVPEFTGLRYRLKVKGSRLNPPTIKDVRGVVLA